MKSSQSKKSDYVIIYEHTFTASHDDLKLIKEERSSPTRTDKAIFKTKLQTAEEVNGNKRWYSRDTVNKITESLSEKAKKRSLIQEIDHPFINGTTDTNNFKKRAITVELKNAGSLIRDIKMDGNDVIAEVETLSGFRGPDLRDLILIDKANIGFSLRMFSKQVPHQTFEGVMEVVPPLRPITFDVVSNPSHGGARVISFLEEGDNLPYLFCDENGCEPDFSSETITLLKENDISMDVLTEDNKNDLDTIILDHLSNSKTLKFKI